MFLITLKLLVPRQTEDPLYSFPRYAELRDFVRTAAILTPTREASRVGTALQRQDPVDPQECSFLLEFETPIELERLAISNERPLSNLSVSTFKNTRFLIAFSSRCPKTQGF